MSMDDARSLLGKLGFSLTWTFGQFGMAAMQPLHYHVQALSDGGASSKKWELFRPRGNGLRPGARRALRYLKDVMAHLPPKEFDMGVDPRPTVLIWSDAMWEAGEGKGGFVVYFPPEGSRPAKVYYTEHVPGPEIISAFVHKETHIGQLELLYAVAPYTSLSAKLAGRRTIHFIDNTSAIAGLVKGYSSAPDSGLIVNAFHAYNLGLGAEAFFEYVRSEANVADAPSRGMIDEMVEALRDGGIQAEIKYVACKLPQVEQWACSADGWIAKALAERARKSRKGKMPTRGEKRPTYGRTLEDEPLRRKVRKE